MSKPIIIKPKSHEDWLKAREAGIGASEVAAILGLSPWETPFSLWLRKTHQIPPVEENLSMKMGNLLEPIVVQLWEESTGFKAIKASAADIIYQDPEHPWRKCTPDRVVYEILPNGRKSKALLQCKTSRGDFDFDNPPIYYICQCQYEMHITGIHVNYLACLSYGIDYGHVRLTYDKEFAEFIAERVDKYWLENIVGGKEPDLISVSDYTIKGSEPGTSIEADSEAVEDIGRLREVNASIADLTAKQKDLKDKLELFMGENESLTFSGETLATWKSGKKGRTFLLKKQKEG